jgi:hypothetical protein
LFFAWSCFSRRGVDGVQVALPIVFPVKASIAAVVTNDSVVAGDAMPPS